MAYQLRVAAERQMGFGNADRQPVVTQRADTFEILSRGAAEFDGAGAVNRLRYGGDFCFRGGFQVVKKARGGLRLR